MLACPVCKAVIGVPATAGDDSFKCWYCSTGLVVKLALKSGAVCTCPGSCALHPQGTVADPTQKVEE